MTERELLILLRNRIPFLSQIPDGIFFNLDTSEFYLPDDEISAARADLEQKLNHYVMTYKLGILNLDIPVERHLCANLRPAQLTEDQLMVLRDFEEKYGSRRVSFVVYQNPLVLIDPFESDMHKLYVKRGRI